MNCNREGSRRNESRTESSENEVTMQITVFEYNRAITCLASIEYKRGSLFK